MGLPDELLDELLSAHLDDVLSGDERARVEQMLRDDPAIEGRLEQLRQQRDLIRRAALSGPKLPENFAELVVQSAIDQARDEDLPTEHPLRMAADESGQNTVVRRSDGSSLSMPHLVATIVGVAASVLFISLVVYKFGGVNQTEQNNAVAIVPDPAPSDVVDPQTELDPPTVPGTNTPETAVADSNPTGSVDPTLMADAGPETTQPSIGQPDAVSPESTQPESMNTVPSPEAIASADKGASDPVETPATIEKPASLPALSMVMVVEIKQSEAGKSTGAFDQALATVEVDAGSDRKVDEKLVQAIANDQPEKQLAGSDYRVVLLESPVKKLDQLVNQLINDRDGIEAIGFSAITVQLDAPLLRSIESVRRLDPTKVRHEGKSFPIVHQNGDVMAQWVSQLRDRRFAPVRGDQDAQAVSSMAAGPNPMANILFLIR